MSDFHGNQCYPFLPSLNEARDLDYFTVSLHSPNGRQFACKGQSVASEKTVGISRQSHEPKMPCGLPRIDWTCSFPLSAFRLANRKNDDTSRITDTVSNPTDNLTTTRLRLCNSLPRFSILENNTHHNWVVFHNPHFHTDHLQGTIVMYLTWTKTHGSYDVGSAVYLMWMMLWNTTL